MGFTEVGLLEKTDGKFVEFDYKKKSFLTHHIPQASATQPQLVLPPSPTLHMHARC